MNTLKSLIQVVVTVVVSVVTSVYLLNVFPFSKDDASILHETGAKSNKKVVEALSTQVIDVASQSSPAVVRLLSKDKENATSGNTYFGSGFIFLYKNKYYILSNEHVIHDIKKLKVINQKGIEIPVKLVGKDFDYDIALLQIVDNKDYPFLKLGNSDSLKIGEFVVAIGHPLGLDFSSSFGIVSALEREISMSGRSYEHFIQTDASINPGNSGGPLLNLEGEVVGINTAVMEDSQGLGFSISVNHVKSTLESLVTKGKIERPFVGVYLKEATENAVILEVMNDSPAKKAGLKKGDLIISVENFPINSSQDFISYIKTKSVGDEVLIKVKRNEEVKNIKVKIGEKKEVLKNN